MADSFSADTSEELIPGTDNKVHLHARKFLSMGLLYLEYQGGIREGDGKSPAMPQRPVRNFKKSRRSNYALEIVITLYSYYYGMSPRQAHQLLWSRFVNARIYQVTCTWNI